jgi:CO dehydrogenase/acetyl-CoA synthase gamma subunit (corrinoid Fe-S protein)
MLCADLYEDKVSLDAYLSSRDCRACGFQDRGEFLEKLRSGQLRPQSCQLSKARFLALMWAARPEDILPPTEVLQLPSPGPSGLYPMNDPGRDSPVLVSGNSDLTIAVLSAVLATTVSPFWYLVVDTDGHTVDMALVYEVINSERIVNAFEQGGLNQKASESTIYLPGLAAPLCEEVVGRTGRPVVPGPVCAAELPLFFGETVWQVPVED